MNNKQEKNYSGMCVFLLVILTYAYLSNAFTGQNLHVWGDEITYSIESRSSNFKDATYPVYIYLWIISLAHTAQQGFLEFARSINAAMFAISLPFIYMTAVKYAAKKWAVLITALVAAGPIGTYSAYFMPDTMYFAVFCIFAWFTLAVPVNNAYLYGLGIGVICAIASMVKPHGLLLLFLFVTAQLIGGYLIKSRHQFINNAKSIGIAICIFLILRLGVGWYLGGDKGLSFIGAYSEYATVQWSSEKIRSALSLCGILIKGHCIALLLLTGPAVLCFLSPVNKSGQEWTNQIRLRIFVALSIGLMFLISIFFSVRIADGAPLIDTMRLHMRYYNLIFPLMYIVIASTIHSGDLGSKWLWALILAIVLSLITIKFGSLNNYAPLQLDSPELRGVTANQTILATSAVLVCISLFLFGFKPSIGSRFFLSCALPLMAITGSYWINSDLRHRMIDLPGDMAGKITKNYLGNDSVRIGFFGDIASIYQAMFYAGDSQSFTYRLPVSADVPAQLVPGMPVPGFLLPPGELMPAKTKWAVVFGKRNVPFNYDLTIQGQDWALYKIKDH